MFTTAKGLCAGLPLGATVLGEKVEAVLGYGDNGSTFGGNPICCAGAISTLSRHGRGPAAGVRERSERIVSALTGKKGVKSVSGLGLLLGIDPERDCSTVISECLEEGVLVLSAHGKVRLLPALNIPLDQLDQALAVLVEVPGPVRKIGQHRTIWQEHSAKDFASYESYKRAGILYVFPPFITARMGAKDWAKGRRHNCAVMP